MLKNLSVLFYLAIIMVFTSCENRRVTGANGISYNNATEYNQYIVGKQTEILRMVFSFIDTVQINPQNALLHLDSQVKKVESIINDIKGMPAYKGNTGFRDAAIESFIFYAGVFKNEYKQMTELLITTMNTDATPEQIALNDKLTEDITRRETVVVNNFLKAQRGFAKENRLKLQESKEQKKFEKKLNNLE